MPITKSMVLLHAFYSLQAIDILNKLQETVDYNTSKITSSSADVGSCSDAILSYIIQD